MRHKFRAWDKTVKRMVTPDSLYHNVNFGLQCNKVFDGISTYTCLPEELILMQFTGLYDKNGKEIYEGDILRLFSRGMQGVKDFIAPMPVNFKIDMFNKGRYEPLDTFSYDECEIVGNIHENPELLEQK